MADLETTFSEVATTLFAFDSVPNTLQRIVDLAEATIDGCDAAGIFTVESGTAATAAASDELVHIIDRLQIELGEGPCREASVIGTTYYADDLVDEHRWPSFSPRAVDAGIRSVLASSLSVERSMALNLYGRMPAAFSATGRAQAALFATLAGLALDAAEERDAGAARAENLLEALQTRELIGQAQGILMERERITADQAFDVLRRASQRVNVKLRTIAKDIVATHDAPDGEGTD